MIGICLEIKTACKYCSQPLMLNSYTQQVNCGSCNKQNQFPAETWKTLLDPIPDKMGGYKLGEGGNLKATIGDYTYMMMLGRQDAQCNHCEEKIDIAQLDAYSTQGNYTCTQCKEPLYIRKVPALLAENTPGVHYLVGEDQDQISTGHEEKIENGIKPILFGCPSCAGSLKIDGTSRMVDCPYCNSSVYLPDDLWHRLHPVKQVQRWYMIYDEAKIAEAMPGWYEILDVACDAQGNIYVAASSKDSTTFTAWSITPDFKTRWMRTDLPMDVTTTGITTTADGNIYLWDKNQDVLFKLSGTDGSTLQKIEGNGFRLNGCTSLVGNADGSILALVNSILVRYNEQGERIELWDHKKLFGSFGIGEKIPDTNSAHGPDLDEIQDQPKKLNSSLSVLYIGNDGQLYIIARKLKGGWIARYDKTTGKQLMSAQVPYELLKGKAWTDTEGCTYFLNSINFTKNEVIKISADGKNTEVILKDKTDGGDLKAEGMIAVAPDGRIYVFSVMSQLKVFSPDHQIIYLSKQSRLFANAVKNNKGLLDKLL